MRALWTLPLALALALSGCLSSGTPADLQTPDVTLPVPTLGSVNGCAMQLGILAFPMASARQGLPEGLTPVAFDETGHTAALLVASHRCAEVRGGDRVVADLTEAGAFLLVEASDDLARPDADLHAVYYAMISPDPANLEVYRSWGIDAAAGNVTMEDYQAGGAVPLVTPAGRWVHSFAGDENFTAHLDLFLPGSPGAGEPGGLMRFFVVDFEAAELRTVVDLDRTASDHSLLGVANFRIEAALGPTGDILGFVPQEVYSGFGLEQGGEAFGWTFATVPLESLGAAAPGEARAAPRAFGAPLPSLLG